MFKKKLANPVRVRIIKKGGREVFFEREPDAQSFFDIDSAKYLFMPDRPETFGFTGPKNQVTCTYIEGEPNPLPCWRPLPNPNSNEVKAYSLEHFQTVNSGIKIRTAYSIWRTFRQDIVGRLYTEAGKTGKADWMMIAGVAACAAAGLSLLNLLGS